MRNHRPTMILMIFILAIVISLVGLTRVNYLYSLENPGGNDFMARWMGARFWLIEGISPYDSQVSLATQQAFYGRPANPAAGEDIGYFAYPLTSMVFFAPFGLMNYVPARALWMTLIEICLFLLAITSLRLVQWKMSVYRVAALVLFTLIWYHGMRTILLGQFAAIEALLMVAALLMIQRKNDFMAGFYLALATSKPQMAYLFIFFVLVWAISVKRKEIIWGFLMVGGLLLAISLIFIPDWPLQMVRQVLEYPAYTKTVSVLAIIAGLLPGIADRLNIILNGTLIAYLLIEWIMTLKKDWRRFFWTACLTLVVTNFITIRIATTNYLMLLPVLFVILKNMEDRWGMSARINVVIVLLGLLAGLWWLFLTTVQGNQESQWMYLPLPIFCLVGLWWLRWWYENSPRVWMDQLT